MYVQPCKNCGKDYPLKDNRCPHCRYEPEAISHEQVTKGCIGGMVFLIVVFSLIAYFSQYI